MDATDVRIPVAAPEHCAGTVHRPDLVSTPAPCIVLANGVGMTRRDGVERFAAYFTEAGFITLTFDFRHLGDSDGEPRQLIDLTRQIEDLQAAAEFARSVDGVDPDRVGVWGFSLGGGVALAVAAADDRIAATVLLCPMVDGSSFTFAGDARNNLRIAAASVRALVRRRLVRLPLTASPGEAAIFTQAEAAEGFEAVRAPDSFWHNEILSPPLRPVVTFRPVRRAARVPGPLLACVGLEDTMVPPAPIERSASAAPRGELRTYPMGHFGGFVEHFDDVAGDHLRFLTRHLVETSTG